MTKNGLLQIFSTDQRVALNHSDVYTCQGLYGRDPELPFNQSVQVSVRGEHYFNSYLSIFWQNP